MENLDLDEVSGLLRENGFPQEVVHRIKGNSYSKVIYYYPKICINTLSYLLYYTVFLA